MISAYPQREGGALPAEPDRAVVNGAGQAVSALRASVPSAVIDDVLLTLDMIGDVWTLPPFEPKDAGLERFHCQHHEWITSAAASARAVHARLLDALCEAQAIEAGTAETEGLGAKHESAVGGNADAPGT